MRLKISGINKDQRPRFLEAAKVLLNKAQAPLRLGKIREEEGSQKILYLRERTWCEFFLENLILTPQEMEDVHNKALAAIELAFFSLADEPKEHVVNEPRGKVENDVGCQDDSDNFNQLKNSEAGNDETIGADENASLWKDRLKSRVFGKNDSRIETESPKIGYVQTFNGLLTVAKGISVSTCSSLQVIAHHVIVGSVGAMSLQRVDPYSPLKRALEAFKSTWGARKKTLKNSLAFQTPIHDKNSLIFNRYTLDLRPSLKHLQNLHCIPDSAARKYGQNIFSGRDQNFWKEFYMQELASLEGSVVCELYPDGYYQTIDESGEPMPFCSRANLMGALNAARQIRREKSANGQEPPSIMFICSEKDLNTMSVLLSPLPNSEISDRVILKSGWGLVKNGRLLSNKSNHLPIDV